MRETKHITVGLVFYAKLKLYDFQALCIMQLLLM